MNAQFNMQITKQDVRDAGRVYKWLLFTPIVAMPCWLFTISSALHAPSRAIWGSAIPLIFYAPVFIWAFAPKPYLRAHARQGVLLLALRFFFAVLASSSGAWGFLLINAFLLLFGSLIGLDQAGKGRAWLGSIRAEIVSPRLAPSPASGKPAPPQEVQRYLGVFRAGDPSAREDAVRRLEALGQVESF